MLLNEVQKQAKDKDVKIEAQQKQIDTLTQRLNALERQVRVSSPEHVALKR
jgi:cell division protein FtsL